MQNLRVRLYYTYTHLVHHMLILSTRAAGESKVFFTGSITTLRKHILRGGNTHLAVYIKYCESESIEPHEQVINSIGPDDNAE